MSSRTIVYVWTVFVVLSIATLLSSSARLSAAGFLCLSLITLTVGAVAIVTSQWAGRFVAIGVMLAIVYFRGFEIFALWSWLTRGFAP